MAELNLPLDGGCLCGRVRFRITAAPVMTMACHCRGCQRLTSSAYSLSALTPEAGFEVTTGEPVVGGLHGPNRQMYCDWCKSWMFTYLAGFGAFVNVRTTLLDDPEALPPFTEVMAAEKLSWVSVPVEHSYPGFPPTEDTAELMAAYAAQSSTAP